MFEGEFTGETNRGKGLVSKVYYVNLPGAVSGLRFSLESFLVIQSLPAVPEGRGQQVLLVYFFFNCFQLKIIGVAYSELFQIPWSPWNMVSPN